MGLGLVVAIVGMCWSWGWSVGTGEGATFGPELPLAEAVVTVADRMEPPVGCGFLGQSVLVAVYEGLHGMAGAVGWCHLGFDGIN